MQKLKTITEKKNPQTLVSSGNRIIHLATVTDERKLVRLFLNFVNKGMKIPFEVTENLKPNFVRILKYFMGDENSGYDLRKGLYIFGDYGVGKSYLMYAIQKWLAWIAPHSGNGFQIASTEEILQEVAHGKDGLDKFTFYEGKARHLLINEFMKPVEDKIYGTSAQNILDHLIMTRYDIFQKHRKVTHVTSNYSPVSADEAIADRLPEMFNFIEIKGRSLRK